MILNASAENGSSSEPALAFGSFSSLTPLTGGMSIGDGMYSITASSMRCTPLFLKAVPHSIGWISLAMVRVRRTLLDFVLGQVAFFEVLVHQLFVGFGGASTIFSRHSLQVVTRSAGCRA
jgi:hypothetical protein